MTKVEIVGPKEQLLPTLELLRDKGVFHPEVEARGFVRPQDEAAIKELLLDEASVGEKQYYLCLQQRIVELLACLPDRPARATSLQTLPIIKVLNELVDKHLHRCRDWRQQLQVLREETDTLAGYARFWQRLQPLVADVAETSQLVFFGIRLRNTAEISILQQLLEVRTSGRCQLTISGTEDGSIVGLITTDSGMEQTLRELLFTEQVPELSLPEELAKLPFQKKLIALNALLAEKETELQEILASLTTFSHQWLPIYQQALAWLEERLSLYQASALAYETRQCFLVNGWMPSVAVAPLRQSLSDEFAGQVVVSELSLFDEDLDRVPVILQNPLYLKPFELFARLLPLPKYTSYDPTPFLGLFFPLLFGMILGDIGYGLVLGLLSGLAIRFGRRRRTLVDGAKILCFSAAYAVLFGLLFGELFGDLGEQFLHLQPVWQERSQAIVPMIIFTISVGSAHILLGLILGIGYDFKRRLRREAVVKILNLLVIVLSGFWLLGLLLPTPWNLSTPLLLAILLLLPLLFIAGGMLAPLELLKCFGNIISYVRIMAIGLCSVLLAQIANQLGGMAGNLLGGILVAGVLHLFNLLLGVFAPTVHALRLHYVEFFGKFLEFGGREFRPLVKKNDPSAAHN